MVILENIDIDMVILEKIYMDIHMDIAENIVIDMNFLENINIDIKGSFAKY